jgi:hypothetical protein
MIPSITGLWPLENIVTGHRDVDISTLKGDCAILPSMLDRMRGCVQESSRNRRLQKVIKWILEEQSEVYVLVLTHTRLSDFCNRLLM